MTGDSVTSRLKCPPALTPAACTPPVRTWPSGLLRERLRLFLLAALFCLSADALADPGALPPRALPPPLARGGQGGFLAPAVSTGDLAAHLRGTLLLGAGEGGPPAPLLLGWQLGASVSLWRWAEAGASFSGRWHLGTRVHEPGPVELWLRAGPPDLGGVSLQLLVEHASGRGGFDLGGSIWPSTTTLGAVAGWRRGRIELGASVAYQAAGEDLAATRYHGLQPTLAAWLTALRSGPFGLQLGGEVLARAGGAEGLRGALDFGWSFAAAVRLVDEHGAAFAAGYGQGQGAGLAGRAGYVRMGYSWGRGYVPPPPDPRVPPLLDGIGDWLRERWARRHRTRPGAPLLPPPGLLLPPPASAVRLPPARLRPPSLPTYCGHPLRSSADLALRSCTTAWDLGRQLALGPEPPVLPPPHPVPPGLIAGGGPPRAPRAGAPRGPLRTRRGGTGYTDPDTSAPAPEDLPAAVWTGGRPGGSTIVPADAPTPPPSIPIRPQPPGPLPAGVHPESVPPFLRPPAAASALAQPPEHHASRPGPTLIPVPPVERPMAEHARPPQAPRAPASVRWVPENATMSERAQRYQAQAPGARRSQAPVLERPGAARPVKFDGVQGEVMVEVKTAVLMNAESRAQIIRQSEAAREAGRQVEWHVPDATQARRAQTLFDKLGIMNITVRVVPEEKP